MGYEYPSKLGPALLYTMRYDVDLQRPDKLRVIVPGDGPASEFYYDGKNTPRDLDKALSYFEQASLQGHAMAQFQLGTMFFKGEGVPANNIQAYIVLKMAAVNGAEDALDTADMVAEQMPRDQLETATQILGQIFRKYLQELQSTDARSPFSPLP